MDDDLVPPIGDAIANGWATFAETVLPSIGGVKDAPAHIAFYFGAMYVLQILEQVVEHGSAEAAALTLSMLTAELEEFMKAHAVKTQ
jgi:hypothetical protein